MNRNSILTLLAIILFILAAYMIYLGSIAGILPPTVTGLGFIIIGIGFLTIRK